MSVKRLLDTHIWLLSALDPDRLSRRVRRLLEGPKGRAVALVDEQMGGADSGAQETAAVATVANSRR